MLKKALSIGMTASILLILIGAVVVLAQGSESELQIANEVSENTTEEEYNPDINPEDFVKAIDNPYFPLIPGTTFIYEGGSEEDNTTIQTEVVVTNETREVMGINTTVVKETDYEDGELIEETFDWYAQDNEGNVWYFGEDSRKYEDGEVVSTAGSWEAGVNNSKPGIIMKGDPQVGDAYYQEFSPDEAEDQAEVVSLNETVNISYGIFENCLMTREWNPLEPENEENKYYAPGVGLLIEEEVEGGDERLELVEIITYYGAEISSENFTETIDNTYFPLISGTTFVYEGERGDENETLRTEVYVSNESKVIMGVNTTVVREMEYEDEELEEESLKWYAQDNDGNIWFFGENSTKYDDGEPVGAEDSWEAGVNGSIPGIIMKGDPQVGDIYYQAFSPLEGVVEIAEVVSLNENVTIPYGSFEDVLKTKETDLLEFGDDEDDEEGGEYSYYASDVGMILETETTADEEEIERLELVDINTE